MKKSDNEKINSYLIFKLGEEKFAVHAGKVRHILELVKINSIPRNPSFIKGIINLRGTALPVVDTPIIIGMCPTLFTPKTCIIVIEIIGIEEILEIGILVDSIQAVIEIEKQHIKKPPTISVEKNNSFITGMVEYNEKYVKILDIEKVFTINEILSIKEVTDINIKEKQTI
ncbi:MAG: chemotaxis protein CheW [Bacteroidales bacterium]